MAPITTASMWDRGAVMASSVDTAAQGFSKAQARPLAAATPMRRPVKEPGPAATAMTSISWGVSSAFCSMDSTMGISVRLWVRPVAWSARQSSFPSRSTAQEADRAELSMAKIFIGPSPPR